MNISTITVVKTFLLSGMILSFYRWGSPKLLNPFRRWMSIPSLEARFPARDVYAAVRLVAAATLQAAFFFVLFWLFRPVIHIAARQDLSIVTLCLAALLGIAEMAVVTLLGFSLMRAVAFMDRRAGRGSPNWSAVARGGWIQMYFKTVEVLPKPFGYLGVLLYIAFEECIFRVIVIGVVGPTSQLAGLICSTALFVYYQKFHTPGWRTAMFPMLGALVVGVVHGIIYGAVPNVFAIVVAHLAFFASALWSMKSIDKSRAGSVSVTYDHGRLRF